MAKARTDLPERPITDATPIPRDTRPARPPRARGAVRLSARIAGQRSQIADLRQAGSLKCLFPRRDGDDLEAVLVNTAGGITGGDRFEIAAQVAGDATLTLTTQTAERAYAARDGEVGQLATRLDVATGARLNWIPQETILFDRSALRRRLTVSLAPGASALIAEPVIFGRGAMGEEVRSARFEDRIEVRREDRPLYLDAMRFDGDIAARLDRPHAGNGARALVSLVYLGADAGAQLGPLRAMLPETGGASLIGDDLLVLRLLAADGFTLRRTLIPILACLIGDLPRCWMI